MERRPGLPLLLIALACFVPMIAAYLLYYYGDPGALPRVQNEDRLLVSPAVPLPALPGAADADGVGSWGPKWSLLYARTSACDARCRQDLVRFGQVHAALGRDQERVRRVYVGPDPEAMAGVDPALRVVASSDPAANAVLDVLARAAGEPGESGRLYVIDPHGNLVLSYPPDAEQRGMLEDLERLLDVSQIG